MREDRFAHRTKFERECSEKPDPGTYAAHMTGIGKQVLSTHTSRPVAAFGGEGRFGEQDPRAKLGPDAPPLEPQAGKKPNLLPNPPNAKTRLMLQPGPGHYEVNKTMNGKQVTKRTNPAAVFSQEDRMGDLNGPGLARPGGPASITVEALKNQPGPGSYQIPSAFGDQPLLRSNPAFRFGKGYMHDIEEENLMQNQECAPYPRRPQTAPSQAQFSSRIPGATSGPTAYNTTDLTEDDEAPPVPLPSHQRPIRSPRRKPAYAAAPPISQQQQNKPKRPQTAKGPRSRSIDPSTRRPASAKHPQYGYGPTRVPLHEPYPPTEAAISEAHQPRVPRFSYHPTNREHENHRPASAIVRPMVRSSPRTSLVNRPQSAHPASLRTQLSSEILDTQGGINPVAFKKAIVGTRYWETSPIRQHPNADPSHSQEQSIFI